MAEALSHDRVVLASVGPNATILRPNFPLATEEDLAEFGQAVKESTEQGQYKIILELVATRAMSGRLIEVLLETNDQLRPKGGWLQLAKLNAVSVDALRLTGVVDRLAVLESEHVQNKSLPTQRQRLGDILVAQGVITEEQVDQALAAQKESGGKLGEILIEKRLVTDQDVLKALSGQLSIPQVSLRAGVFDPAAAELIPKKAAVRLTAFPLFKVHRELIVATPNAQNVPILRELEELSELRVRPVFAPREDVLKHINQSAETTDLGLELMDGDAGDLELVEAPPEDFSSIDEVSSASPVVNLTNSLIQRAINEGASDVHIESFRDKGRVRFRIDGVMYEVMTLRAELMPAFISRLKVMANLDIAERRLPQDGRMQVMTQGRTVDLRFSSLPGLFGEKVVLRILDKNQALLNINNLGMADDNRDQYVDLLGAGYGLILLTGPTGSGKTTSLYAALNQLNSLERNIITIEDPVEYQMEIINQNEVRSQVGLTFASILKHALRQDPDIIMVGEIRESETASIAVQAALTGHLVLSTLHTNDSVGAITRLLDMGIEPYLLSSALIGVVAQRLVRTICPSCKSAYVASPEITQRYDFSPFVDVAQPVKLAKGRGCKECYDSGYRGRAGIHEVISVNDELQQLIVSKPNRDELTEYLTQSGVRTLFGDGLRRVSQGETTIEEIMRVVNH